MPFAVAALYQFTALPDPAALRDAFHALAGRLDLCGTLLLAREGVNGTLAGRPEAVEAFLAALAPLSGGRIDAPVLRRSAASEKPFGRRKIRVKREVITFGAALADPASEAGIPVRAADWNALVARPGVTLVDTRNAFEVARGSFEGAIDPALARFSDFPAFAAARLDPAAGPVALFCTGGIRCEKAGAHLRAQGFPEVYQLSGGILAYLDAVAPAQSRWRGDCFVFDGRVALGHGLVEAGP